MLSLVTRLTVFYAIFRWLRPRWLRIAMFLGSLFLISYLHSEYTQYVELTDDHEDLIFFYKLKYYGYFFVFVAFAISMLFKPKKVSDEAKKIAQEKKMKKHVDDGFDFLRTKKILESRADKVLNKGAHPNVGNDT